MHFQSDYGYVASGAVSTNCGACGSGELFCCNGAGKRLSFDAWAKYVDAEICRVEGTEHNFIEAPYAEMYQRGLSIAAAVEEALN